MANQVNVCGWVWVWGCGWVVWVVCVCVYVGGWCGWVGVRGVWVGGCTPWCYQLGCVLYIIVGRLQSGLLSSE